MIQTDFTQTLLPNSPYPLSFCLIRIVLSIVLSLSSKIGSICAFQNKIIILHSKILLYFISFTFHLLQVDEVVLSSPNICLFRGECLPCQKFTDLLEQPWLSVVSSLLILLIFSWHDNSKFFFVYFYNKERIWHNHPPPLPVIHLLIIRLWILCVFWRYFENFHTVFNHY